MSKDNTIGHKLIQSYLLDRYFVSTIYRKSSAGVTSPPCYYETIVWEWDKKTRKLGSMISVNDSGSFKEKAIKEHFKICEKIMIEGEIKNGC